MRLCFWFFVILILPGCSFICIKISQNSILSLLYLTRITVSKKYYAVPWTVMHYVWKVKRGTNNNNNNIWTCREGAHTPFNNIWFHVPWGILNYIQVRGIILQRAVAIQRIAGYRHCIRGNECRYCNRDNRFALWLGRSVSAVTNPE
jgi:hypothetical protein